MNQNCFIYDKSYVLVSNLTKTEAEIILGKMTRMHPEDAGKIFICCIDDDPMAACRILMDRVPITTGRLSEEEMDGLWQN